MFYISKAIKKLLLFKKKNIIYPVFIILKIILNPYIKIKDVFDNSFFKIIRFKAFN
jgi:hypothetical protein